MAGEACETQMTLAEEYRTQGNHHYKSGLYSEAIQWYTKAINEEPSNALLYNNRSAAYMMMKKYSEAHKDASRSVLLDPQNVKFLMRLTKCCLNLGDLTEAKRLCSLVRELEPLNTDLVDQIQKVDLLVQTYQAYETQLSNFDLRHALHIITKCIELAPGCVDFHLRRLNLLIQLKRFTEAKCWVENLLHSNDNCVELLFYRGLCLYYMEHLDKAISHFQHVLRLHPDHVETQKAFKRAKNLSRLKEQGNAFIHECKYSKAYEAYSQALELDPLHDSLNAKLHCNRACALFYLNRFEESLKDCDLAINLDSVYVKAHSRRAKCLTALEEYEKAVEEWKTVVQMDPTSEHKKNLQAAKISLTKSKQLDYYKVLGLKKNASFDEIKQAYKKYALLHHPDRHTDADEVAKREHEQKFKEVGEAYSVLSDPQKRQRYDNGEFHETEGLGQGTASARTLFTQVFPGFGSSTVHFCFG